MLGVLDRLILEDRPAAIYHWTRITFVGLTSVAWFIFYRLHHNAPFPPGPRGLPLAGNLLDLPSEKEWLTFTKWGETYDNILSVSILGRRLVVINSAQTAIDILDKNGAVYSDRPIMGMIGELMDFKKSLVLLPYGARFRNQRRLVHHELSSHSAMNQSQLIIEHETSRLLRRLSVEPEHLSNHIRKTTGAIMLRIIYGYEIQEENDPFLELVERSTHYFALAMTPGKFLVNLILIMRHVPDWFPGAGFKQIAKEWRATIYDLVDRTHNHVKQQMAVGNGPISFCSKLFEDEPSTEEEQEVMMLAATLYGAGSDTVRPSAAIYAFFKAMLLFPDVQTTAQAEIDAIVGCLPYVNALVLEGVPHSSKKDGVQSGYFIPKNAFILANIWKMLHDPVVYKNPFDFNPDRFIRTKDREPEADPYGVAFGFGRRMLADSSIFIVCAMVLATFNISKYSENGVILEPDVGHTAGNISHPTPFKSAIKARSEKALSLINREGFA
ncbi:cytochrome P450 [Armillaria luteobubalina]|uniref:Cytochrome P450 n=1 Tax=Armillaria luteobubalina TaxID=153913 RepID=A0AA39PYD0_9AGAR|nr:cytochrome P450 [Armillaria luteobubalina]